MNQREKGNEMEQRAVQYLQNQGCEILERNYRIRGGEIDIIARQGEEIVFVEVKYRHSTRLGEPAEAVGFAKQRTISRVSDHYRMSHGLREDLSYRFDVIGILGDEIRWYQDAFEYVG